MGWLNKNLATDETNQIKISEISRKLLQIETHMESLGTTNGEAFKLFLEATSQLLSLRKTLLKKPSASSSAGAPSGSGTGSSSGADELKADVPTAPPTTAPPTTVLPTTRHQHHSLLVLEQWLA